MPLLTAKFVWSIKLSSEHDDEWKANEMSLREVVVIHDLLVETQYVCLREM